MKVLEIKSFEQVILFSLQRRLSEGRLPELSFSELWQACTAARPRLPLPSDPSRNRSGFSRQIFEDLRALELLGLVSVTTSSKDGIESVRLLERGCILVQGAVFSHQERMSSLDN